jgi:hypothetical protein
MSGIAARSIVAWRAPSPSSPAPAARRFAASGLDRSVRPSKHAARAADAPSLDVREPKSTFTEISYTKLLTFPPTGDPATLASQIDKLKRRFDLAHVVLVGDRGMITQARIDQDIKPAGLDWITALRAPQIRALLDAGAFQLSLFDERDLASITADDYPN